MCGRLLPLAAGAIFLVGGGLAAGQSAIGIRTAVHNCQNPDVSPENRIEACSEVIHTNLASHGVLAAFYYNRAVAYEAAQEFDHAKQDYNKALELKPDFAEAQANLARLSGSSRPVAGPPPVEVH